MSPYPYHCVGILGPEGFWNSPDESTRVPPRSKLFPGGFVGGASNWDSWSPDQIQAAEAERDKRQLAAQKAWKEKSAVAAAAPGAWKPDEPEPGATASDVRVYTKLKNGQFKYWGVREDDMTIEDFWAKFDPENTRDHDDNEEGPINLVPAQTTLSANNPSSRTSASPRSTKSPETPQMCHQHRVRKSETVTPQASKRTRKSLATKVRAGLAGLDKQAPDILETTPRSRGSAAPGANVERSYADTKGTRRSNAATGIPAQAPAKLKARGRPRKVQSGTPNPTHLNADVVPSSLAKRKRGRPAQTKSYSNTPANKHRPAAENNAKITKPNQRMQRSPAPSVHAMRTRAKGPANRSPSLS